MTYKCYSWSTRIFTCPVSRTTKVKRIRGRVFLQSCFNFFFFSLKEFLPQSYIRANRIEKKIFQEHKAIQGASEIEAKQKYVKLARGLPTFGVHFFLVKVSLKFLKI